MSHAHLSRSTLLSCSLADEGVCMRLPDGSTVLVDNGTVERSETLTEYLASAGGGEFIIPVSPDIFGAWLSLVDELKGSENLVQARLSSLSDDEVVLYLQAADFFADSEASKSLAYTAAARLFATPDDQQHTNGDDPMLEVIEHLTTDTVIAILVAADVSLERQLGRLSRTLHTLAVHASFPSLRREGSLELQCGSLSTSAVTEALDTFNAIAQSTSLPRNLKTLKISDVRIRSGTADDSATLLAALGQAVGSRALSVSISNCAMGSDHMTQLMADLGKNSTLRSLHLSYVMLLGQDQTEACRDLRDVFSNLKSLECLELEKNALLVDLNVLSQVGTLTSLTRICIPDFQADVYSFPYQLYSTLLVLPRLRSVCLPLVLRKQDDNVAAACICHLQHLSSLSLLEAKSTRFPGIEEVNAIHMKSLMRDLAKLSHLRTLDVSSYSFRWRTWRQGREGEKFLAAAVKCMPFLKEVAVSVCRISDETICIAQSLLHTKSCQQLRFRSHSCRPVSQLRKLITLFSQLPDLTDLDLDVRSSKLQSCRSWRTAGHTDLRLVLEHEDSVDVQPEPLGQVTRLFIGDGSHCCSGVCPGAFLDIFDPVLQHLHVDSYHIHGVPGSDFVDALNMQTSLRTLCLTRFSVSAEHAGSLARAIASHNLLEDLELRLHRHCGSVPAAFYRNLAVLPQLRTFTLAVESDDVDRPAWTTLETDSVAMGLQGMHHLKSLTFNGWYIDSSIMMRLAAIISTLTSLEELSFTNSRKACSIEFASSQQFPAVDLASCFSSLRNIRVLQLRSVGLTEDGLHVILRELMHAKCLEKLHIEATLHADSAHSLVTLLNYVPSLRDVEGIGADVQSALTVLEFIPQTDPMRCFQLAERCRSACGA